MASVAYTRDVPSLRRVETTQSFARRTEGAGDARTATASKLLNAAPGIVKLMGEVRDVCKKDVRPQLEAKLDTVSRTVGASDASTWAVQSRWMEPPQDADNMAGASDARLWIVQRQQQSARSIA